MNADSTAPANVSVAFGEELQRSALFRLPSEAHAPNDNADPHGYVDELRRWIDFGIIPFQSTATTIALESNRVRSMQLTSVMVAKPDNLLLYGMRLNQVDFAGAEHTAHAIYDLVGGVRPHIRGRGDAVQFKDYVVHPGASL